MREKGTNPLDRAGKQHIRCRPANILWVPSPPRAVHDIPTLDLLGGRALP